MNEGGKQQEIEKEQTQFLGSASGSALVVAVAVAVGAGAAEPMLSGFVHDVCLVALL
jgi:hypothetical protein